MIEIRPLNKDDERKDFHSGNPDLDHFFIRFAGKNQFRHYIGVTWVAVENEQIHAYATVSPATIEIDALPSAYRKRLPGYPLPVLRLTRLAVAEKAREQGLGKLLLRHIFTLALSMKRDYGCLGVLVDAKSEAVSFYQKYGFIPLDALQGELGCRPRTAMMFLSIKDIPDRTDMAE